MILRPDLLFPQIQTVITGVVIATVIVTGSTILVTLIHDSLVFVIFSLSGRIMTTKDSWTMQLKNLRFGTLAPLAGTGAGCIGIVFIGIIFLMILPVLIFFPPLILILLILLIVVSALRK